MVFWFRDFVINYSAPMESNAVLLDSMGKDFCKINNGKAGRIRRKTQNKLKGHYTKSCYNNKWNSQEGQRIISTSFLK